VKIPPVESRSPFLEHADQMINQPERSPFMLTWVADREQFDELKQSYNAIYIAPIITTYLEQDPKKPLKQESIDRATASLYKAFINAVKSDWDNHFSVADQPGPNTFTLELALIKLQPTNNAVNIVQNIAGFFVPGGIAVTAASNMAGAAVAHEIAKGHVAIALKVRDGVTGELYAQAYDERADRAALLLNTADFTVWGNARLIFKNWASEFTKVMNSNSSKRVLKAVPLTLFLF